MGFYRHTTKTTALAALIFATVVAVPTTAAAGGYVFDEECGGINSEAVDDHPTPNALLMLDRSASMSRYDGWNDITTGMRSAIEAMYYDLHFGLGYFSEATSRAGCDEGTEIVYEASRDHHDPILERLDDDGPCGSYTVHDGIEAAAESDSMHDPDRPSGALIITDGYPEEPDQALEDACTAREQGHLMYSVGVGGTVNRDFNNMLAAAMGTGCCGDEANEQCTNGVGDDPCDNPNTVDPTSCQGAYLVDDPQQLENALLEIGAELACTFDIDTSDHSADEAPDDPDAVRVEWQRFGQVETIPHRGESDDEEGWYFPSTTSRDEVALTDAYCNEVRGGGVEEVTTRLACDCESGVLQTGDQCTVDDPGWGECDEGVVECEDGYLRCTPLAGEDCDQDCPNMGDIFGQICHVDNEITADSGPAEPRDPGEEIQRCQVGRVVCSDDGTEPICEPFRPMPEMCDGLDNSCDGDVDNITDTWSAWYDGDEPFEYGASGDATLAPQTDLQEAGSCWHQDICVCSTAAAGEHLGDVAGTEAAEFESYIDAWEGIPDGCRCDVYQER